MPDSASDPSGSSHDNGTRRLTFPKSHRLKRQRLIRSLFNRRRDDVHTVTAGCVRLLFRVVDRDKTGQDVPLQIGFAPGRRASPGVERTRVRRLLREVYRVNQTILVDLFVRTGKTLIIMVLFRGDPTDAADAIPRDLPRAMQRVAQSVSETSGASDASASDAL